MPIWLRNYLKGLTPDQKAELGFWILTEQDDNLLTTEIMSAIDQPGLLLGINKVASTRWGRLDLTRSQNLWYN